MGNDTYYDILGVARSASQEEIKSKYRDLIRRIHPDLDGPAALFRQVQEAYEVLSDPPRRAAYDRLLDIGNAGVSPSRQAGGAGGPRPGAGRRPSGSAGYGPVGAEGESRSKAAKRPKRSAAVSGRTNRSGRSGFDLPPGEHPAGVVAAVGVVLLVAGFALGQLGVILLVLGGVAIVLAAVGALGARGRREREAFQRVGMTAIDAMTSRQFEVLLEHFFASKGHRVARLASHGRVGADMFLEDGGGRTVVQVKRWNAVVDHDAVQQAVVARDRYGVERAMLVTSSSYSPRVVSAASSNRVTLWNRATLAQQLAAFPNHPPRSTLKRFTADVQAGSRICLGLLAVVLVTLGVQYAKARRRYQEARRG